MSISLSDAINLLINNPDQYQSVDQLADLVREVSAIDGGGNIPLVYSGVLGDNTGTGQVISALVSAGEDINVVDKTSAARLLNSDAFLSAWGDIHGLSLDQMRDESFTHAAKDLLFHPTNSPWADVSQRFSNSLNGDIRTIIPNAESNRIFAQTELPALLNNPAVRSINGIPVEELNALNNPLLALDHLRAISDSQIALSGLNWGLLGGSDVFVVTPGDFLDEDILDVQRYLILHPEKLQLLTDNLSSLTPEQQIETKTAITSITNSAKNLAQQGGVFTYVNKLGVIGGLLGLALASSQAAAAETPEEASEIMTQWAVSEAGSEIGAIIGGAIGAVVLAAIGTVTAPVAGAILIGAALAGSFFLGDEALAFYDQMADHDGNGRKDILDRLSVLLFGKTPTCHRYPRMM